MEISYISLELNWKYTVQVINSIKRSNIYYYTKIFTDHCASVRTGKKQYMWVWVKQDFISHCS